MGAKHLDREILNRIREQFEAGYNLYDLAIKNFLNYDTLRNISRKEGWQKGSRTEAIRIAELELDSEKCAKARQTVKNSYKTMTKQMRTLITSGKENVPEDKEKEEAILKRVQSISILYGIDKDLHNILTSKEETDILTKKLKNQKLKEELLPDEKPLHIS